MEENADNETESSGTDEDNSKDNSEENDGEGHPDGGVDQRHVGHSSREVLCDERHVSIGLEETNILEEPNMEEGAVRARTNQAGGTMSVRAGEQESIPLFFPRESALKTQSDRRLWAANLALHHPDFNVYLRGKNVAYITVKGEEAATLLTSLGYANVVM